jgi:hypothetical protein
MIKRFFITAIVVLAMISLIAPVTYAIPTATLMITDPGVGGGSVTILDNSPQDGSAVQGIVSYNGAVGNWHASITTGITKPSVGDPVQAYMDIVSADITLNTTGTHTLDIEFSELDFGPSSGSFVATIGGTLSSSAAATLDYDTYYDGGNGLFAKTNPLTSLGTFGPGGGFTGTTSASVGPIPNPYSITQVVTLTHTGDGNSSFDAEIRSVPEPSIIFLLGSLLIGLGLLDRKRFMK